MKTDKDYLQRCFAVVVISVGFLIVNIYVISALLLENNATEGIRLTSGIMQYVFLKQSYFEKFNTTFYLVQVNPVGQEFHHHNNILIQHNSNCLLLLCSIFYCLTFRRIHLHHHLNPQIGLCSEYFLL